MTQWLKQSTAATVCMGPFVDDTDGKTAETGLTIAQADIRLTKNGGDIAQTHNAAGATHDELGMYSVPLDDTDTATLGRLKVVIYKTGALPVWQDFMVVPANVWDSMFGADYLQVDVTQLLGTAWLTPGTAGTPDVNTKLISGDATAADNLEAACDGNTYNVGGGAVVAASCTASTPALIADAVCDEVISTGHAVSNSVGKILYDNLNAPVATVDTVVDGIATDVAAVHVHAQTIETDVAAVHVHAGAIDAKTVNLPSDPADQSAVEAAITAAHATTDGKIDIIDGILDDMHGTDIPAIKTVVDANGVKLTAIQGKTDMFPVIWFAP